MRIPVSSQIDLKELKENIERDMPGLVCRFNGAKLLVVTEPAVSKAAAANVLSWKKKVVVNEGFATMGGQLLFVMFILLFGILIPGIIYYTVFFPKQKAIRNKVGEYVKQKYAPLEVK